MIDVIYVTGLDITPFTMDSNPKETIKTEPYIRKSIADELVEALKELLSGHDNLYIANFGQFSDPLDDIAAKPAREALSRYQALTEKGE